MSRIEGRALDGKGGTNEAAVSAQGRQEVNALVGSHFSDAVTNNRGFLFYSTYSATGGEEVWLLQNDGTDIRIDRIIVSTSASGIFTIMRQTSGTAAGTTMNGRNGILGNPVMPDVTAFGGASVTGTVDGEALVGHDVGTSTPFIFALDELVIPRTEALFVRAEVSGIIHVVGLAHRNP